MKHTVTLCATIGALTLGCVLLWAPNYPVCQPPIIDTQPAGQTRNEGQNVSFSVVVGATSTPPLNYQWRANEVNLSDGDRISGATNATLTIYHLIAGDAASYSVVVSNSCVNGVVTSSVAPLTILAATDGDLELKVRITEPKPNSNLP